MKKWWLLLFVGLSVGCAGGMPSVPSSPDAILAGARDYFDRGKYFQARELYKAFLARYPGNDRSDEAQFYLAESHFYDEEYPLAAIEYRVLVGNYGYSDYVDDAFFKVALCAFQEAPRADLDQTKSFEALSLFRQFMKTFPKSPLVEEARRYIGEINKRLAEKDIKNGLFYYRQKRYDSASIYFEKVIDNYEGNRFWVEALYYQANILLAKGDKEDARSLLEKAMEYPGKADVKKEIEETLHSLDRGSP